MRGRKYLAVAVILLVPWCLAQAAQQASLEVTKVQFEPLQQGKNVVRVEVRNTSDQNQVFRTHIQTRSPDYAGGVGWGTGFFETIPAPETIWTRFVFKIQGPVTESTYIRLTFANPGPQKGFDEAASLQGDGWKQSFKQTEYKSRDLAWAKTDGQQDQPVSAEQASAITEVLRQIQGHVREGRYAQAWPLFTKDYQKAEFQATGLDRFIRAMEPKSPMDFAFNWEKTPFLGLKTARVVQRDEKLRLAADTQGQTWTLDFVQEEGQWKLDWIAGHTPRALQWQHWEDYVLPRMKKHVTEHFDVYFFEGSTAAKEIERIAKDKERGYQEIGNFLGTDPNVHIRLVLFEDETTKLLETGHQGMGWAYGQTIVEVYNEKESLDPFHEAVHVLMGNSGRPPALFNEGLAVYMSQRLGAHALKDLGGGQATIEERAREMKAKGEWIELAQLIAYTEIGSAQSRPPVAYAEAASFVKFLIDTYGKDKFLQIYRIVKNSEDPTIQARNVTELAAVYGTSLPQLQKAWEASF